MIFETLPIIERNTGLLNTWPWTGAIILAIIISLVTSISVHKKKYKLLVGNLINSRSRIMNYDKEETEIWANILIWIIIAFSYSLTISAALQYYKIINEYSIKMIILPAIGVGILLLLKYGIIKFCGFVFGLKEQAATYINAYFLLIFLFLILFFPISIGLIYGAEIIQKISLIILILLGIAMFNAVCIKLFQIFFNGISSLFYIFLYLCAMEILPVFILLKIVF